MGGRTHARALRPYFGGALALGLAGLSACGTGGGGAAAASSSSDPAMLTHANTRIGPCVNMGNHLEAPNEGELGRAILDSDFAAIAAQGFETVRLPVRFSNHAGASPPYAIDPAFMDRVEHVVDTARAAGLRVILDLHHYDDPQGSIFADPAGETERFAALWRQIGERFKGKDSMVWFELLNEPHDQITHANLLSVLEPALEEVRATNPTRPVVIGGEFWSGIDSLDDLPLPDDRYIVAAFHYYEPFEFTHQGATWVDPVPPMGKTYPGEGDGADLAADVEKARDFIARTGRPLFMGEYGAHELIPLDQRVTWYGAVHDAFAAAEVDGCVWGYTNTFPFRDPATNTWYAQLLDAIGL